MEERYTLTEVAELMAQNKWHLIKIDEEVRRIGYGVVELRLDVRAGEVEKVTYLTSKAELRPKKGHEGMSLTGEVLTTGIFSVKIE